MAGCVNSPYGSGALNSTDEVPSGSQTLNGECLRQPACTNIQETYAYNNRMQMAVAELGTSSSHTSDSCREYSYDAHTVPSGCSESSSAWPTGTTNNGNVGGYYYADSANTGLSHPAAYTYDGVNRLIGAAATGNVSYNQTYSYDIYGNLNCSPSGPGCVAFSYNANKNQINGYGYDQAGNVTNDGTYNYQWDAEGHLGTVSQSGNVVSMNTYNALGQRVEDATATSTTDEAYGAGGDLLLRYTGDSNSRSFVPFGGGLLAEYFCGGMIFDHPDELGSLTASTDCTGHTVNEKLFYPFGESWTGAALPNLGAHQTFGKLPDYDPETDQYNTANRHYSPSGRWMSPDPGGLKAVLTDNPQTWNMYAYTGNNPTTVTDPSGESWWTSFLSYAWPPYTLPHQAHGDPPPEIPPPPSPEAQVAQKQPPSQQTQQTLVIVVTSDTTHPANYPPGVTERDRNYTVETKEGDTFHADTSGKHSATMNETQTGGNDKPTLADPNQKGIPTLDDQIHVTAPGNSFSTTQTLHIDGSKANATIYDRGANGKVVSGTTVYVHATARQVDVTIGP